jgi:hypothetical protein
MTPYRGLEKVDQQQLAAQRLLTEALWTKLREQGIRSGSTGRIESYFWAKDETTAASLTASFKSSAGWDSKIEPAVQTPDRFQVKIVSPEATLNRKAFLELIEVMMVAAHESKCVFDGFQVDHATIRRKPWWRLF